MSSIRVHEVETGLSEAGVVVRKGRKLLPGIFVLLALLGFGEGVLEAACGGSGETPCSCSVTEVILEGCEACRGSRFTIPFANECTDTSGWPASCGGTNEPVCSGGILQTLGIGACKPGRINVAGTCRTPDSDGYPTFCGGSGERPCRLDEKFPACKLGLLDLGGTCVSLASLALDDDDYPRTCGDVGEPACLSGVISALFDLGFHIEACKPHPTETIVAPLGTCTVEEFPNQCGRNGQRPCTILEKIPSCMSGLRELSSDFGVCGTDPIDWDETDASEASRGGPRTVFFIHGRGGDYSDFGSNELAKKLLREAANVSSVYGIDWNNAPVDLFSLPAPIRTRELLDTGLGLDDEWEIENESWGAVLFDAESYEITEVAFGAAQAIRELETEGEISIVAGSFGGVMARQLVYRHYDELRKAGKKIVEVITMGSPHRGGLAGDVDYDPRVAELQTKFACLEDSDRNGCLLGEWIEWTDERARGSLLRESWYIDDRSYPQIRWITLAANGQRLDLSEVIDPLRTQVDDPPSIFFPKSDAEELLGIIEPWNKGADGTPFPDSDGTITVRSAFGMEVDECYPFVRIGSGEPSIENLSTPAGDTARCVHGEARVDPRIEEGELDADGVPSVLDGLGHSEFDEDANVQGFVLAALNLFGDTTGDGRVDENVLVAEAGADYAIECTGSSTVVNLDASDSFTGNVDGLGYLWTGPFGTANGAMTTVSLPLGEHGIVLDITDPSTGFTSSDTIVVTVSDTTAPSVDDGLAFSLEATSTTGTLFDIAAQGSDLCGDVTIESAPSLSAYPLGTTVVTVTATDGSGNQATGTITVEVVDTTPPVLSVPADVVAEANALQSTVLIGEASATDLFPVTVSSSAPPSFPLGDTLVVWTATDENGNSATGNQLVRVVDTTPPVLSVLADVVAEANAVDSLVAIGTAVATDIFPVTVSSSAPPTYPLGTTTVVWTASDANGNVSTGTQSVTVVDTTPPVVTAPPDVVVLAAGLLTPVENGTASATDIFGATVSSDAPASFPTGPTTVTWTGVDGNGNEATATQLVEVVYQFGGFAAPIQPGGRYKANRTLPVKFDLFFADATPASSAVARLDVFLVGTDDSLGDPLDVQANGAADAGNRFRYNGNHYQFNLSTNGWAAGRYRLVVELDDGRSHPMDITLR